MIRMSDTVRLAIVIAGVSAFWALTIAGASHRAPKAGGGKQLGAMYFPRSGR